jgi:hypothetical protein
MPSMVANRIPHRTQGNVSQRSTTAFRAAWRRAVRQIVSEDRHILEALAQSDRDHARIRQG